MYELNISVSIIGDYEDIMEAIDGAYKETDYSDKYVLDIFELLKLNNPNLMNLTITYEVPPESFKNILPMKIKQVLRKGKKLNEDEIISLIKKYGTIDIFEWAENNYDINKFTHFIDVSFYGCNGTIRKLKEREHTKIELPFQVSDEIYSLEFSLDDYTKIPHKLLKLLSYTFRKCEVFVQANLNNDCTAVIQLYNGEIINSTRINRSIIHVEHVEKVPEEWTTLTT